MPYARQISGIQLTGDAYHWWPEAAGRYARGQVPQAGAVLSFERNGRMPLGHVAVVTGVVGARRIVITHANWPVPGRRFGQISKDISVVDVSPDNSWSAVRVSYGRSGRLGAVYRTHGFIYGRSGPSTQMASSGAGLGAVQFASAPSFDGPAIAADAPDRALR